MRECRKKIDESFVLLIEEKIRSGPGRARAELCVSSRREIGSRRGPTKKLAIALCF